MEEYKLWRRTLGSACLSYPEKVELLRQAFLEFRSRTAQLVSTISSELPGLTVHDITHIDALWRVAEEIIGEDYPINPAEAFVLGGAFLLHDAAHVVAAFENGVDGIKSTLHWNDLIAQRYNGCEPILNSPEEKEALFQVLRHLHAEQAQSLPHIAWKISGAGEMFLLENFQLRSYYGDIIGEIAASHHWPVHKVCDNFRDRFIPAPAFLQPATWSVDVMKLALILRCADAAHIDGVRAPWFLFALKKPAGISEHHWQFQARMAQPTTTESHDLLLCSPSSFSYEQREAWWLLYDTALMINNELISSNSLLRSEGRQEFRALKVASCGSPEAFSRVVRTKGWEPVDVQPTISDVPKLIEVLGGTALYGDDPAVAVRELLQNAIDAVRAFRCINNLDDSYGEICVSLDSDASGAWTFQVQDNGIGMSRYVLTRVLLDFGNSLWRNDKVREEIPGLAKSGFTSGGKFGIGFYSLFMLGEEVKVTTRRFERSANDQVDQWQISFEKGVYGRPTLSEPMGSEKLIGSGTRVSVRLTSDKVVAMLRRVLPYTLSGQKPTLKIDYLTALVGTICPTSDVKIVARFNADKQEVVLPNDWASISDQMLLGRVNNHKAILHNVYSLEGALKGRLGLASVHGGAIVTINGVRSGTLHSLAGVLTTTENNLDAKRDSARLGKDIDWQRWALDVSEQQERIDFKGKLILHAIAPSIDFSVWEVCGGYISLSELEEKLAMLSEVTTHEGEITHEDDDDMSSYRFDSFEPIQDLICIPSFGRYLHYVRVAGEFPWCAGVLPIDYVEIFENKLSSVWGAFEKEDEDQFEVGDVDGIEITRSVVHYTKSCK